MFYAHFVLAKKGPLARIWLAAHWDKKLTKAHVFETNIESSVEGILQPKVKMALRTSGHLLLGIVRIYSRKAKYLLADCNEAFIKIKMAFRPGVVDLPEENRAAAVATITLPEVFHDFDAAMPEITIDMDAQVTLNQSRAEDITMKEDYGALSLIADDGFEDMGFDESDAVKDTANIDDGFDQANLLLCDVQSKELSEEVAQNISSHKSSVLDAPLKDDGFGGAVGEGLLDGETGGLFEPAGLFDDAPLDASVSLENNATQRNETGNKIDEKPASELHNNDSDDDMYGMGPGSIGAPSSPESPSLHLNTDADVPESDINLPHANSASTLDFVDTQLPSKSADLQHLNMPLLTAPSSIGLDHTTLISNEEEAFALAPLDANLSLGLERYGRTKRKRKLIVDEVKNISGEEMKAQLSVTSDIVTPLDLAPPTKRLMHWKEIGGVEKLFSLPGHPILSTSLSKAYQKHLTLRSVDNEDFGFEEDRIDLDGDIEQGRDDELLAPRKRRREIESMLPHDLSHLDTIHLDSSKPPYSSEHNISHSSLDVQNFMQNQHHVFPSLSNQQLPDLSQQHMMSNVLPSVLQHPPPAHMIHQMLQNDVSRMSHMSQIMHPMVDSGPPTHTLANNMHSSSIHSNNINIHTSVVTETYNQPLHHSVIEPVSQHLLSDNTQSMSMPDHMKHHSVEKLPNHPSFENQINHPMHHSFHEQSIPTPVNHLSYMEADLRACSNSHILQPSIANHQLQNSLNNEIARPIISQNIEPQTYRESNSLQLQITPEIPLCDIQNTECYSNENDNLPESSNPQIIPESNSQNKKDLITQPESNLLELSNCGAIPPQEDPQSQENQSSISKEIYNKNIDFPASDDEYGAPSSVGPILADEQMADETYEQFEERILSKRTTLMIHTIHNSLNSKQRLSFAELVKDNKRKQVAQKFYTFLVLKKQQAVELEQQSTFADMIITKGPKFDAVYSGN